MEKEDKHLDGDGLGKVWAKIKAQYLALAGGVLNNNALIGWKDSGGTSVANLIQYNTANEFILGYNQRTKGATRIFGKSIVLYTNGETARLTIGDDGVATFASDVVLANTKRIGWVNSGGTTVSNLLQYTSDNKLYLGYGQSTVNDTNIYGKVVNIMTNGNTTRLGIDSSGNTTLSGQLTVSGGVTRLGSTTQCDIYLKRDTIASGTPTNYIHYPTNAQLQFDKYVEGSSTALAAVMTLGADGNVYCHNAIYEGGTLISTKYTYTEGSYVSITNNAISVKEASSSQGGVVTTGAQTIAGAKTFSDNMTLGGTLTMTGKLTITMSSASLLGLEVTSGKTQLSETLIKKSTSGTTPLIVATSYSTGENASRAAIEFEKNDGSPLGYIGCRLVDNVKQPYFYGSGYHTIWHDGIAGTSTTNWACKDLSASGNVVATGGVAAGGIADLTIY